jgi:hypothetical protein
MIAILLIFLTPRGKAIIGYLIGYLQGLDTVKKASHLGERKVRFDETRFYDPTEPLLENPLRGRISASLGENAMDIS